MKKSARKILSLVLSLVLVCTLAVAALAVSDYVDDTIGDNYVTGTANITRYTVSGATDVDGPAPTGYNRSVNVAYTYYLYNYNDANDYRSSAIYKESYTTNTAYIAKSYMEGQIYSMRDCTATFQATIVTDTTTAYFRPRPLTVTYYTATS